MSKYCRTCGKSTHGKSVCENCGCLPESGHAYCNNCGAESLQQAVMCPQCRFYFSTNPQSTYVDSYEDLGVNRESNDRYRPWLVAFVILCLCVAGYKYFSGRKSDVSKPKSEAEKRYEDMQNYINTSSPDTSFTPYKAVSKGNEEDLKSLIDQTEIDMMNASNWTALHNGEMDSTELTELRQQLVKLKKIKQSLEIIDTWSKDLEYEVNNTATNIKKIDLQISGLEMKVNGLEEIIANQQKYHYTPPVVKKEQ